MWLHRKLLLFVNVRTAVQWCAAGEISWQDFRRNFGAESLLRCGTPLEFTKVIRESGFPWEDPPERIEERFVEWLPLIVEVFEKRYSGSGIALSKASIISCFPYV